MENNYKILVSSLKNLSKNYSEQVSSFPDFVDVFDEVISDFDNAFHLLPTLMDKKLVSYEAVKEMIKCRNLIELNLSVEERTSDESFEFDDCWNLVREYSVNALNLMEMNNFK